jgi:hypothetical protein
MVLSVDGIGQLLFWAVRTVYDYVKDFITLIMVNFPFDNPKKTLMLSILLFLGVFLVINLFSSTPILSGGVQNVRGDSKYMLSGAGDESQKSGGEGGLTTSTTQVSGVSVECLTDNDCHVKLSNEDMDTACCLPESYEGYYCAGSCLLSFGDRDSCKLPNSCGYPIEQTKQYVQHLPNSCMSDSIASTKRDAWCKDRSGSTVGYNANGGCCQDSSTICFGFCLKDVVGANCNDYTQCFNEKEVLVKAIEGVDVGG